MGIFTNTVVKKTSLYFCAPSSPLCGLLRPLFDYGMRIKLNTYMTCFRAFEDTVTTDSVTFQQMIKLFEKMKFSDVSASKLKEAVDNIHRSVLQIFKVCTNVIRLIWLSLLIFDSLLRGPYALCEHVKNRF